MDSEGISSKTACMSIQQIWSINYLPIMYLILGDFLATSSADISLQHTDTIVIRKKYQWSRQCVYHKACAVTSRNINGTDLPVIFLYIVCGYCYHKVEVLKCVLSHTHFQTGFVVSLTHDKMLSVMKDTIHLCCSAHMLLPSFTFLILIIPIQLHSLTHSALKTLSICYNTQWWFICCLFCVWNYVNRGGKAILNL